MRSHAAVAVLALALPACGAQPPRPAPPGTTVASAASRWWVPKQGATWQIQYAGSVDLTLDVDVYNLDAEDTTKAQVQTLTARGVKVICYINAGAWEDWRPDRKRFPAAVLGRPMAGWKGERWLDIRRTEVLLPLMRDRMRTCAAKGFHAVDADNVMGYAEATGFAITAEQQLRYNRLLARTAHGLGLGFGLKNDQEQVDALLADIDFAVNEECIEESTCDRYARLLAAGKAVFNVEYQGNPTTVCANKPRGFSTVLKSHELGPERRACA